MIIKQQSNGLFLFFLRGHQVDLIDALREVAMQEPGAPWMFEDHRYILDNADRIKKVREKGINDYSMILIYTVVSSLGFAKAQI